MSADPGEAFYLERERTMPQVLREYWRRKDWGPWSPDEFYPTWGGLLWYAWALLRCQLTRHPWRDTRFTLYGQAGDTRQCDRCGRSERFKQEGPILAED